MAKRSVVGDNRQYQKFVDAAREIGCEDDEAAFDQKLKRVATHSPPPREDGAPKGKPKPRKEGS